MNDYEYLGAAYATSSFSDFAKQFPMTENEAFKPKVVSKRNQLTQRQTDALIKLWEKWYSHGNLVLLKLSRLAYSPYGTPYITIERRDDLTDKKFKWDWCISYHEEYDGQGISTRWYSNLKEPMPDEIRTFLRNAYDIEFMSILQTNL